MFLTVGFLTVSAVGMNTDRSQQLDQNNATIEGKVVNRFRMGCSGAQVIVHTGPKIGNTQYVTDKIVGNIGSYSISLTADEQGTKYFVWAVADPQGTPSTIDNTNVEEITVYPGGTYRIPNLILKSTPNTKSRPAVYPLFQELLQRLPVLRNLLCL